MDNFWIWIIAGGLAIIICIILAVTMYRKGKKRGQLLSYAEPMKKDDDEATRGNYLRTLRPFLPKRILDCLGIKEGLVTTDDLRNKRVEITSAFLNGGYFRNVSTNENNAGEIYDELNKVLAVAIPAITDNKGALEGIRGGYFRALYPEDPESALICSIKINDSLAQSPISIGLCYGHFLLGVVGNDSRMGILTISAYARVARALNSMALEMYARILATGEYVLQIKDFEKKYNHRIVGKILFTESEKEDLIYDVFEGDPVEQRTNKRKTKTLFEKGIKLFFKRKFSEARGYFIEVLKADHNDNAARHYLFLCDSYQKLDGEEAMKADIYLTTV